MMNRGFSTSEKGWNSYDRFRCFCQIAMKESNFRRVENGLDLIWLGHLIPFAQSSVGSLR